MQKYDFSRKLTYLCRKIVAMNTKHIQMRDYDYPLPDERIAKFPLEERDSSKLLVYRHGKISETLFRELPELLPEGALMVFNNTRVIQARLHFRKAAPQDGTSPQGALIEVFLLEPALPVEYQENFAQRHTCVWYCLVGNLKKWKGGSLSRSVTVGGETVTLQAERTGVHGSSQEIRFRWDGNVTWAEVIDAIGELPIPPYLNRPTQESDKTSYQTVYSKIKGSVAAPTAGLHFTERVLRDIDAKGIEREEVTLHVGAGTFRPVKSDDIGGHDMHTEHIAVNRRTIRRLLQHEGRVIAVGTTSVRTLESLYYMGVLASRGQEDLHVPQWMPYEYDGSLSTTEALEALLRYMDAHAYEVLHAGTQIIIAPGYRYRIVRRIITNFHQPQSTLLLLVSAFVGEDWHRIYDYALAHDFRFLSYGDSSLLIP